MPVERKSRFKEMFTPPLSREDSTRQQQQQQQQQQPVQPCSPPRTLFPHGYDCWTTHNTIPAGRHHERPVSSSSSRRPAGLRNDLRTFARRVLGGDDTDNNSSHTTDSDRDAFTGHLSIRLPFDVTHIRHVERHQIEFLEGLACNTGYNDFQQTDKFSVPRRVVLSRPHPVRRATSPPRMTEALDPGFVSPVNPSIASFADSTSAGSSHSQVRRHSSPCATSPPRIDSMSTISLFTVPGLHTQEALDRQMNMLERRVLDRQMSMLDRRISTPHMTTITDNANDDDDVDDDEDEEVPEIRHVSQVRFAAGSPERLFYSTATAVSISSSSSRANLIDISNPSSTTSLANLSRPARSFEIALDPADRSSLESDVERQSYEASRAMF